MNNYKIYLQILFLYVAAYGADVLATYVNPFFWSVYLPVVVAANVLLFDETLKIIDLDEIKTLKDTNKYLYILSICVLSAGFAIAMAIFMK
jgi:hypothetical protein